MIHVFTFPEAPVKYLNNTVNYGFRNDPVIVIDEPLQ